MSRVRHIKQLPNKTAQQIWCLITVHMVHSLYLVDCDLKKLHNCIQWKNWLHLCIIAHPVQVTFLSGHIWVQELQNTTLEIKQQCLLWIWITIWTGKGAGQLHLCGSLLVPASTHFWPRSQHRENYRRKGGRALIDTVRTCYTCHLYFLGGGLCN